MNGKVKAVRDVLVIGCGGILGQLVAMLCMPVLTRLYSPLDYGQWALLVSLALIPGTLATMRYELAVLLPSSDDDGFNVCAVCVGLATIVALLIGVGLYLLPESFLTYAGLVSLRSWFWAVPLLIVTKAIHQASLSWLTRIQKFLLVSAVTAALPLTTVACQILQPWLLGVGGSEGLIYGSVVAHAGAALAGVVFAFYRSTSQIRSVSISRMRAMMVEYRSYPFYMTPYTLTSELRNRLVVFFFSAFSQTAALGFYVFSERVMRVSVTAISSAMRPVFYQRAAAAKMSDLEIPVVRSLTFMNRAATPLFVLFWFCHADLYEFVFSSIWRDASVYGVMLSVPVFVLLHTNWLDRGMDVLKKQRAALLLEIAFSGLSIGMLVLGLFVFESVFVGVLLQCCAIAVYNAVWLVMFFKLANFDTSNLVRLSSGSALRALGWATLYGCLNALLALPITVGLYLSIVAMYGIRVVWSEWQELRRPCPIEQEYERRASGVNPSEVAVPMSTERRLAG